MASEKYTVVIRNNNTLEERSYEVRCEWSGPYIWTDGNFSCDCNRHLFFSVAGEEDPDDNYPCGQHAYSVIKAILPDGSEVMIDCEDAVAKETSTQTVES